MTTEIFLQRCHELAAEKGSLPKTEPGISGPPGPETSESDSLIGFFQLFRPDGENLGSLFDLIENGERLHRRLQTAFDSAGDDRRPQGGRDAFFIVRSPGPLPVEAAEHHCQQWLQGLAQIARHIGEDELAATLAAEPRVRVLEGIPPKHPKPHEGRTPLLTALLEHCGELTSRIPDVDPHADLLRSAYYFIACDAMLRDYLMWPFYAGQTGLEDPLRGYFHLWSHGVKFRVYQNDQIDLYLPRQS